MYISLTTKDSNGNCHCFLLITFTDSVTLFFLNDRFFPIIHFVKKIATQIQQEWPISNSQICIIYHTQIKVTIQFILIFILPKKIWNRYWKKSREWLSRFYFLLSYVLPSFAYNMNYEAWLLNKKPPHFPLLFSLWMHKKDSPRIQFYLKTFNQEMVQCPIFRYTILLLSSSEISHYIDALFSFVYSRPINTSGGGNA